MSIKFFSNKEAFYEFSNHYPVSIVIDGINYPSSEHYYMALKYLGPDATAIEKEYAKLIAKASTPNKAKYLANQKGVSLYASKWYLANNDRRLLIDIIKEFNMQGLKMRKDFNNVKNDLMRKALKAKFDQHENLRKILKDTDDAILEENSPTDNYWGNKGLNMLGKLLMELRDLYLKK